MAGRWRRPLLLRREHERPRATCCACLDAIERTHPAGVEREVLVLDNASERRLGRGGARARRRRPADRARAARPARRRTTPGCCARRSGDFCLLLNEDSELQAGAVGGAARGARGAIRAPPRPGRSCSTPAASRSPAPGASPGSARRWSARSSSTGGSPCRAAASEARAGRLGPVERAAGAPRGRGGGRLPRPRLLRLLRRVRLLQAPPRRRLARPLRPGGAGHPPRPALDRPRRRPAAHRRVPPQPRPLHAQAPLARPRRSRCGC